MTDTFLTTVYRLAPASAMLAKNIAAMNLTARSGVGDVTVDEGLVDKDLANEGLVEESPVNNNLVEKSLVDNSLVAKSLVDSSLVNESFNKQQQIKQDSIKVGLSDEQALPTASILNTSVIPILPSINETYAPIGLFDSGIGGLSVYQHLKKLLPNEKYVYYADTLNVPYGPRSSAEIRDLTLQAVDWLVQKGCKLVVIACNSASAHGLQTARMRYPDVPIVGLVPALKPAVCNSQSRHVAVLATRATLDGSLLNDVIDSYAIPKNVQVSKWFDPQLVPWVESGMSPDSDVAKQLKLRLHEFAAQHIDQLVLGCTHYPFFKEFVQQEISKNQLNIEVVDSGAAIADRVRELLIAYDRLAPPRHEDADRTSRNGANIEAHCIETHCIEGRDIKDTGISRTIFTRAGLIERSVSSEPDRLLNRQHHIDVSNGDQTVPCSDHLPKLDFFVTRNDTNLLELSGMINRLLEDKPLKISA